MAIDESKLNAFMGNFVHDLGAVLHAATVVVGDQLGLYKALADGPATAESLARRTQTDQRYLREWLSAQAASGYVTYEPDGERFSLTEEQALALAQGGQPRVHSRRVPDRGGAVQGHSQNAPGHAHRSGNRLARARCGAVPRH